MALQGKIAKQTTILEIKVNGMDFEGMKCNQEYFNMFKRKKVNDYK